MSPAKTHFFPEMKPRSSNLETAQDVMNTNITSRFKEGAIAGFKSGLSIANLDNSGPKNSVTGTLIGPFNVTWKSIMIFDFDDKFP